MAKYMREKGRLRHTEAFFNFEMGGDPDPKHAIACVHGWYHEKKIAGRRFYACVKCGRPEADCEIEVKAAEEARQAAIRATQEGK